MTGQSLRSPVFQLIYSALLDQPSADLCHQVKRIAVLVVDSDAQRLAMRLERGAIALAIMTGEVRLNCRGWHLELLCFVLLRAMAKRQGRRTRTFSVPSHLAEAALGRLEALAPWMPVRRDNLISLLHPPAALDHNAAVELGLSFRPWDAGRPQ